MTIKKLILALLLLSGNYFSSAQSNSDTKRQIYFQWEWNKDYFTTSTLHFRSDNAGYNFILYHVKAHDRPQYGYLPKGIEDFSIAQYGYRLGWYFKNNPNSGIEINFDHAKYVMSDSQVVHMKGTIDDTHFDQDTLINRNFLKFEHTNGANFYLLNYFRTMNLIAKKNFTLQLCAKGGAGTVIPKTDVTIFGTRLDNKYHVAGWMMGAEGDVRFKFWNHLYAEGGIKASFEDYMNVLVIGDGRVHHSFGTFEFLWGLGYQLGF